MRAASLEDLLEKAPSPVQLLRNSQIGPYVYPVRSEFTNWRDEQRAWRNACVLFDQSHHMSDVYFSGPDVIELLSNLGVNSFRGFAVNKAKQFVATNHDGYVIGDAVLFFLEPNKVSLVGRPPVMNWVQYQAGVGRYDVKVEVDHRTAVNPKGRKLYRFQVQGPRATQLLEKLNGGPLPDIKFFNMGEITIAGRKVSALHHGMAGQKGLEIWGPWEMAEDIRGAIVEAGKDFGLRQAGSRAYSTNTLESGWIPSPLPAIYTGEKLQAYRKWLPAAGYEGTASLGGSFYSPRIEDYYLTPYDLGYGSFVKFDHEFVGREALEAMAKNPRRRKVTLAWNSEDVSRAFTSLFQKGDKAKYIDLPSAVYSTLPYDAVRKGGKTVGISTFSGYSANESTMLSLAIVDIDQAEPGTQVTVLWGEEDGGSSKPTVERHIQMEIRATVSPVPYSEVARESYAAGWRTAQLRSI
jgi:glycine cleavage system aminomethyltransferase T